MPGVLAAASSKPLKQSVIILFSDQFLVLATGPRGPVARASVIDCCEDALAAFHACTVDTMLGPIQGNMMSTAPRCKRWFFDPFFSASRMRQTHVENISQSDKTNISNAML